MIQHGDSAGRGLARERWYSNSIYLAIKGNKIMIDHRYHGLCINLRNPSPGL
jgi:hypothetical protein